MDLKGKWPSLRWWAHNPCTSPNSCILYYNKGKLRIISVATIKGHDTALATFLLLVILMSSFEYCVFMNFEHFFWITIVFGTNRNNEIGVRTHRFDCHVCFFFLFLHCKHELKCWFGWIYWDVSDILNQQNGTLGKFRCQRVSLPSPDFFFFFVCIVLSPS